MAGGTLGGSVAPPLTDVLLAQYQERIHSMSDGPVKDACAELLAVCVEWWGLPESPGRQLAPEVASRLDSLLPWDHELKGMQSLFGDVPVDDSARNMAFHLLWIVKRLARGQEPITTDRL